MINKRSGASALLVSLLAAPMLAVLAGCSLDSSDFGGARDHKVRTFVRVHPTSKETAKTASYPDALQAPRSAVGFSSPIHPTSPVVRIARRDDFRRYAVAYGNSMAMVEDRSIIPFALRSGNTPLKRFELPFLRKKKAKEAKEAEARLAAARKPAPAKRTSPKRPTIRVRTTAYTHN